MKSFIIWLKIEVFRFLREPISLFFTLIFPIILVFIFGDSFGSSVSEDGISYYNSLVAIDVSFLIANFTLMGVGNDLANQKENGIDAGMKLLPVSSLYRTVIQFISYLLLLFLSLILLTIYVFIRYEDVHLRGSIPLFLFFMIVGYFFFVNLTKFIVSFRLSARTLQLITSTVFFILLFCSGIVIPKESLPMAVQPWVDWSPLFVLYKTLEGVWNNTIEITQYLNSSIYMILLSVAFYGIGQILKLYRKEV